MPTKKKPVAAFDRQPLKIVEAWDSSLVTFIKKMAISSGVWTQCRTDMKKEGFNDAVLQYSSAMWGFIFNGLPPSVKRLPSERVKWALGKKIDHDERIRRLDYLFFRF